MGHVDKNDVRQRSKELREVDSEDERVVIDFKTIALQITP